MFCECINTKRVLENEQQIKGRNCSGLLPSVLCLQETSVFDDFQVFFWSEGSRDAALRVFKWAGGRRLLKEKEEEEEKGGVKRVSRGGVSRNGNIQAFQKVGKSRKKHQSLINMRFS